MYQYSNCGYIAAATYAKSVHYIERCALGIALPYNTYYVVTKCLLVSDSVAPHSDVTRSPTSQSQCGCQ